MNDMLELLRYKVKASSELIEKTHIWGTALEAKILEAYRAADVNAYWTAQELRWLSTLGDDVVQSRAALITLAYLGEVMNEPHWVALVFDMTQPEDILRFSDSFGPSKIALADLPIGDQEDGFSCGMLLVNARLEMFNRICARRLEQQEIERNIARAEDEDSNDRSDHFTATSPAFAASDGESDSDSDAPVLLRRIARGAKFTFTSPVISPILKSPLGHPNAPTPAASPEKRRILKRRALETSPPPPQPIFGLFSSPTSYGNNLNVFGPVNPRAATDGYGTDSGSASDGEAERWSSDFDEYAWGPQDDAPAPPETQLTPGPFDGSQSDDFTFLDPPTTDTDMAMYSDDASNIPELADTSDSDDSDISDSDANGTGPAQRQPAAGPSRKQAAQAQLAVPAPPAGPKAKITSYWKVETAEEKAVRLERSARVYSEGSEERRAREVDETRKKKARERVEATERMRQYRDRRRPGDAKIAAGEIPSLKRKHVHLLEHDDTPGPSLELPELSRPHRQFKESSKKKNKPSGRKQKLKNQKRDAKYTNWSHPLLWSQIETAARISGKPWSQCAIMKALRKANLKTFHRLSEQVIGTWIDPEAKKPGVSKWKNSILKNVELRPGNAPGGQTTQCGALHLYPETRKKIHNHLTSLRGAGVALTLLTIRALMISHIEEDAPELFHHARADGSTLQRSA
ncbi:hypothetical protein B0H17DRAFT_1194016 [Mycena rosella]|uniref:Ubiquitin-like protease family profile domain-containing protein n=1 Tax=Mycena rosella TaxID=1033263 RepID=A0AAD7M6W5_MYCRO|nr:hypothetical protein B0H17DRAFT_1194016 [Mycena rosella]